MKTINQCDIYVGLWSLYILQGAIYPQGIINQILQILILFISLNVFKRYKALYKIKSPLLKITFILLLMYIIYGGYYLFFGDKVFLAYKYSYIQKYGYIQKAINSLIPIFIFFYFTHKQLLTVNRIKIYLPIFILVFILKFYSNPMFEDRTEFTNNLSYFFVTLIPFIFFYERSRLLQYILLFVIFIYIIMGMKRGAILLGLISIFFVLYSSFKTTSKFNKIILLSTFLLFIIGVFFYIKFMIQNSIYFVSRIEQTIDGDSSGRDILFLRIWDICINEINPLYFYLGRGADATVAISGNYAHQDWLETFCNNGVLGLVILTSFFIVFARSVLQSRALFSKNMYYSFLTLFCCIFLKTYFSMSIQELEFTLSLLLGFFSYRLCSVGNHYVLGDFTFYK